MMYLDKHLAEAVPPGKGEEWLPLFTYRNALAQGEYDLGMAPPMAPRGGRGRPPKQKKRAAEGIYQTSRATKSNVMLIYVQE